MISRTWANAFLLLLLVTLTSQAQETFRLTDFYPGDATLRLQGKKVERSLSIPLSNTAVVRSATLDLKAVSSIALIEQRSILNVRFNNATIAQIRYNPNSPRLSRQIELPVELWRAGFNSVTFAVSQHYANQCVDGTAPELWSEIDLYRSTLNIDVDNAPELLSLRSLSGFFSPGLGGQKNVELWTANAEFNQIKQKALPLIAQGLALRNQYQPLTVAHYTMPEKMPFPTLPNDLEWTERMKMQLAQTGWYSDSDMQTLHVLVGTKDDLSPHIAETTREKINGPYLEIMRTPALVVEQELIIAPQYRLLVSGTNEDEVVKAATTLGLMDDSLNPDRSIHITEASQQDTSLLVRANELYPDNEYTFAEIGTFGEQFRGEETFTKRIGVRLPADFYTPESASVRLSLDFGYGAAMGPGSMMNVLVNDELIHGLPFSNPNGEAFHDYELTIPARNFKGGVNNIDIEVTSRAPLAGVECDDVSGSHLVFQIHDTSKITIPDAGHVAVQPDLSLLADTAYPFAQTGSTPDAQIQITDLSTLSGALTLSAKLAQVTGTLLPSLHIDLNPESTSSQHVFLLATPSTLQDSQYTQLNTSLAATKQWPYQLQNELHNRIKSALDDKSHKTLIVQGATKQQSTLGTQAVLLAEENPTSKDTGTIFMVVAETPALVNQRVSDLVSLSLWGQLAGDFFSWENDEQPLIAMQVARKYEVGEPTDFWLTTRLWLSNNPWYWFGAIVLLVLLCSLLAWRLLRARNQKIREEW